jgi:hypothetical protein
VVCGRRELRRVGSLHVIHNLWMMLRQYHWNCGELCTSPVESCVAQVAAEEIMVVAHDDLAGAGLCYAAAQMWAAA